MKKLIKLLLIASLFLPLTVLGAPPYSFTSTLLPNNSLTDVGSTTLSAYRNIVAQWFTATSTKASLFPYASTTAISAGNAWFTGNVGIGTTSPYSILSISNTRNTPLDTSLLTIASTTNGLSTTTLLTILANGNTGIRNTNPRGYLDVGSVNVNGFGESIPAYRLAVNDQSSGGGAGLLVSNSGTVSGTSSIIFKSPTTGDIRPFSSGQIISGFTTTGYTGAYLGLGSASGANRYNNEVFLTNGRVGIGTTSPESLLDVEGTISAGIESASTAQLKVKGGASGGPMITLSRTSGGTSQYSWALSAGGLSFNDDVNARQTLNLFGDNSQNQVYIGTRGKISAEINTVSLLSATTYNSIVGSDVIGNELRLQAGLGTGAGTPGDLTFYTSTTLGSGSTAQTGTARGVFKGNTGNFGVGTTSPYKKLSVAGDVVMDSFNATSTTATSTIAGALKYGRAGTAILAAGSTTITNIPLDSNSVIFLTVQNCGGSCGQVSVNSVTDSSFIIESTSAIDSSTVGWMVIQK